MKKFAIYLIPIVVVFILGVLLANLVIMPSLVHMGEEVTVPDVCNLPLETAFKELKRQGLDGVVTERRYDPIIGEGKIIIQDPLPKAKAKKGRLINLSVSLGQEAIKVPDLSGVDFDKGVLIIKRLGLVISAVDSVASDSIGPGKIIGTIPGVGTQVNRGSVIELIMSQGSMAQMPDLVGMQLGAAKQVLTKLGLVLGEVKMVEASGIKGSIVIQNPQARENVNAGDTVNLMVVE